MRINNNLGAMNTYSRLTNTNALKEKSLEKLSSGLRINRAADDAAGLAISEKMRSQIKGLNQASRNAQDGISLIQTAEGALSETHSMLQRMRELSVQASNGTVSDDDRKNIQKEITALTDEISNIATKTDFNGSKLLDGSFGAQMTSSTLDAQTGMNVTLDGAAAGTTFNVAYDNATDLMTIENDTTKESQTIKVSTAKAVSKGDSFDFDALGIKVSFSEDIADISAADSKDIVTGAAGGDMQVGANQSDTINIKIDSIDTGASGLNIATANVETQAGATAAITTFDNAIKKVSTQRAQLGAYQNRLEHTMNNLQSSSENMTAAESRIRDVDMAKEMMEFTKNNILSQAATSMLAQANQSSQGVLQLLR
ncbi:flagellin [Clostridium sediminicola]|uniref:flagellar hook-associated protein FlgL n=1 Tax=Clostridium sediminicola TaxID=3114879 RepID=UPI0031F1F35D